MANEPPLESLPAHLIPADLVALAAECLPQTNLFNMLHLVENVFLNGFAHQGCKASHGFIHADRAGRISLATLAGALGARPCHKFASDLVRLELLFMEPGTGYPVRGPAYSVNFSDGEAVVSRTQRPDTLTRSHIRTRGSSRQPAERGRGRSPRSRSASASSAPSRGRRHRLDRSVSSDSWVPDYGRAQSPEAPDDLYWPNEGDFICLQDKDGGNQVPTVLAPADNYEAGALHFTFEAQAAAQEFALANLPRIRWFTSMEGGTQCEAVWRSLQLAGPPWNSTPCTLALCNLPAETPSQWKTYYGVGVGEDQASPRARRPLGTDRIVQLQDSMEHSPGGSG
jgi:hypothetical protein